MPKADSDARMRGRALSVYLTNEQYAALMARKPEDMTASAYANALIQSAGDVRLPPKAKYDEWGLVSQVIRDDGDHSWIGRVRHEFFSQEIPRALVYAAETGGLRGQRLLASVSRNISEQDISRARSNDYAYVSASDVKTYAENVLAAHTKRRLITAGAEMINALYLEQDPSRATQLISEALNQTTSEIRGTSILDAAKDVAIEVKADEEEDKAGRRLTLGYDGLIPFVPRFRAGEVCVWAARSNVGKSIIASNIAHSTAEKGIPVAIFALEMRRSQMARRIASVESGVSDDESVGGGLMNQQYVAGLAAVSKMPIHIDDRPSLSPGQIWGAVAAMHPKPRRVIVDYLGLVRHPEADRTDIAIGESVKTFKAMGKTLGVSTDLFVQINRAGAAKDKPTVTDLKDSDEVLHHVDYVMLGRVLEERRRVIWEMAKNRNYPRFGEIVLARHGDSARMLEERQR